MFKPFFVDCSGKKHIFRFSKLATVLSFVLDLKAHWAKNPIAFNRTRPDIPPGLFVLYFHQRIFYFSCQKLNYALQNA